jgi:hypothetical protein
MKRLLAIFLALIYIATTSGIVINTHYCMGEIADIALGASNDAKCGTCGMENEGCCHDDLQVIKLTENHHYTSINFEIPVFESISFNHAGQEYIAIPSEMPAGKIRNHSPPLPVSRNIFFCVYRI